MLIQASQEAKQGLPNVYVTVLPAADGMPEWVKILISAGVGALFGIVGSTVMEFIKPKISNAALKKAIARQLAFELVTNCHKIDGLSEALAAVPTPENFKLCQAVLSTTEKLKWDRYGFYLSEERGCVYEMDPYSLFQNLLKMPDEMAERCRRYEFEEVKKVIARYKALSSRMADSLNEKPTSFISFNEDSGNRSD